MAPNHFGWRLNRPQKHLVTMRRQAGELFEASIIGQDQNAATRGEAPD